MQSMISRRESRRTMKTDLRANKLLTCALALMMPLTMGCEEDYPVDPAPIPTAESSNILPIPFFVVDAQGDPIDPAATDPGTPLYDARAYLADGELVPVTVPGGGAVTWGDWSAVEGSISVECRDEGTYVNLQLTNLIPNGVYTIWNITWNEDPPAVLDPLGMPDQLIGIGPAGPSDGSQGAFTTSATGEGSITVTTPPGALGTLGEIGACALTDEYEWHVVGLYHYDGQTHGSQLGPIGTMAEQFGFVFQS